MDSNTKMSLVVGGLLVFFCVLLPIFLSIKKRVEAPSNEASGPGEVPPDAAPEPPKNRRTNPRRSA